MQLHVPAELVQALDEEQQQLVQQQQELFSTQYEALQTVLQLQIQLSGEDPRTKQEKEQPATTPDIIIDAIQPPPAPRASYYLAKSTIKHQVHAEVIKEPMNVDDVVSHDAVSGPKPTVLLHDTPLTTNGERLLITCFMLQDDLNPALSRLLAAQARAVVGTGLGASHTASSGGLQHPKRTQLLLQT